MSLFFYITLNIILCKTSFRDNAIDTDTIQIDQNNEGSITKVWVSQFALGELYSFIIDKQLFYVDLNQCIVLLKYQLNRLVFNYYYHLSIYYTHNMLFYSIFQQLITIYLINIIYLAFNISCMSIHPSFISLQTF